MVSHVMESASGITLTADSFDSTLPSVPSAWFSLLLVWISGRDTVE
jgi:hypothetical protein